MANTIIDWDSIDKKVSREAKAKINESINLQDFVAEVGYKFEKIMSSAISDTAILTANEAATVASISFELTGYSTHSSEDKDGGFDVDITMDFDFSGDKTLVSISPNKQVHDLVALFNNGYESNNVDPERPPRGYWHGKRFTVTPRGKSGAHFIQRAIEQFTQWAEGKGIIVYDCWINEIYTGGV